MEGSACHARDMWHWWQPAERRQHGKCMKCVASPPMPACRLHLSLPGPNALAMQCAARHMAQPALPRRTLDAGRVLIRRVLLEQQAAGEERVAVEHKYEAVRLRRQDQVP